MSADSDDLIAGPCFDGEPMQDRPNSFQISNNSPTRLNHAPEPIGRPEPASVPLSGESALVDAIFEVLSRDGDLEQSVRAAIRGSIRDQVASSAAAAPREELRRFFSDLLLDSGSRRIMAAAYRCFVPGCGKEGPLCGKHGNLDAVLEMAREFRGCLTPDCPDWRRDDHLTCGSHLELQYMEKQITDWLSVLMNLRLVFPISLVLRSELEFLREALRREVGEKEKPEAARRVCRIDI